MRVVLGPKVHNLDAEIAADQVVMVDSLDDVARYVNVATQTIGIYPHQRETPA